MCAQDRQKGQVELFRSRLENTIDPQQELVRLANRIDWKKFEDRFGSVFAADGVGRPALPTRLIVGFQYLKYTFNVSGDNVVAQFLQNPYMILSRFASVPCAAP